MRDKMQTLKISGKTGKSLLVLGELIKNIQKYCNGKKPVIITDENVFRLYKKELSGFEVIQIGLGENAKTLETVEKRLKRSVQAVGTVRFNPFRGDGSGGNQSFASAFVSEKGDGVVISSIYSRDLVGIYAKPVENGVSRFELTQEEKEAVTKARETANA